MEKYRLDIFNICAYSSEVSGETVHEFDDQSITKLLDAQSAKAVKLATAELQAENAALRRVLRRYSGAWNKYMVSDNEVTMAAMLKVDEDARALLTGDAAAKE